MDSLTYMQKIAQDIGNFQNLQRTHFSEGILTPMVGSFPDIYDETQLKGTKQKRNDELENFKLKRWGGREIREQKGNRIRRRTYPKKARRESKGNLPPLNLNGRCCLRPRKRKHHTFETTATQPCASKKNSCRLFHLTMLVVPTKKKGGERGTSLIMLILSNR